MTKRVRVGRPPLYLVSMNQDEYLIIGSTFEVLVENTIDMAPDDILPGMPEWAEMYRNIAQVFKENK